jgi:hypothetical protein
MDGRRGYWQGRLAGEDSQDLIGEVHVAGPQGDHRPFPRGIGEVAYMRLQLIQARGGRYLVRSCLLAKPLGLVEEVCSTVQRDPGVIPAVAPGPVG